MNEEKLRARLTRQGMPVVLQDEVVARLKANVSMQAHSIVGVNKCNTCAQSFDGWTLRQLAQHKRAHSTFRQPERPEDRYSATSSCLSDLI